MGKPVSTLRSWGKGAMNCLISPMGNCRIQESLAEATNTVVSTGNAQKHEQYHQTSSNMIRTKNKHALGGGTLPFPLKLALDS